ncbi:hypothetical protein FZ103_03295 [Streptomonospora sp. PA3]|uniref:FitA-like ribbon-helix-helix domain-containing protein n=1 Tax=Streptomonospora sp. PA3 TaxID=2607326 RepID=UPI0012DD664C|nr:hypothetical protein [Streptomonospora sp. PA3]MUL40211.1 hypothetical protein [Streptomonospora sp. PA3]
MGETSVVQVRDVPSEAVDVLKARAARRGLSFAAYLRELIIEEAGHPDPAEVMDRLANDDPIDYSMDDLREFMNDGRR